VRLQHDELPRARGAGDGRSVQSQKEVVRIERDVGDNTRLDVERHRRATLAQMLDLRVRRLYHRDA
jgi:hypothetical protein